MNRGLIGFSKYILSNSSNNKLVSAHAGVVVAAGDSEQAQALMGKTVAVFKRRE